MMGVQSRLRFWDYATQRNLYIGSFMSVDKGDDEALFAMSVPKLAIRPGFLVDTIFPDGGVYTRL